MQPLSDVRRWAAVGAAGVVRLLMEIEGDLVDTEGAVADGNADLAAMFGRRVVLGALSVNSLSHGGRVDVFGIAFDPFENVERRTVERATALMVAPVEDAWDGATWLKELTAFISDVEMLLELGHPLPRLRSADSMFGGLAAARPWIELCVELGVAPAAIGAA